MVYPYSKRTIKCWAVVEGKEFDVVDATVDFALNTIPSATITLATGLNVKTLEASNADELGNNLFNFRAPILIYYSYVIDSEELVGLQSIPDSPKDILFDGYITGFGCQRTSNASVLSISIEHWLSDLTASSMISSSTHSTTPGDLQRAALLRTPQSQFSPAVGILSATYGSKVLGAGSTVIENLWENGFKKIIQSVMNSNALADLNRETDSGCLEDVVPIASDQVSNVTSIYNKAAEVAISKIIGFLKFSSPEAIQVADNIKGEISAGTMQGYAGQTIWDNILSASASYMFAVVPRISDAEVIPFLPNIFATDASASITGEQISSISISGDMPRTIRGVAVLMGSSSAYLPGSSPKDNAFPDLRVGGTYISKECKGTVLYKQAPGWLQISGGPTTYSRGSDKQPPYNTSGGDGGNPSNLPPKSKIVTDTQRLRDDYAKTVFGFEILKGRQGVIVGPFRTDIGVGSYIEFEVPESKHNYATQPNSFRGIVLKVGISISAQSSESSTTFTVGYVRSFREDVSEILTMQEHPLYDGAYVGRPL
jgi:hypothetical protein